MDQLGRVRVLVSVEPNYDELAIMPQSYLPGIAYFHD